MSYEYMAGLAKGLGTEPDMDFATSEQAEEQRLWDLINQASGEAQSGDVLQPLPSELQEPEQGAPAAEKETWWTGDVEGMVSSFFNKLGIGQQANSEAQDAAREAAGETQGPTSLDQVTGGNQTPSVNVDSEGDDETPWYVQYAPHMIIGGLGLGAGVLTLAVVMKKRD